MEAIGWEVQVRIATELPDSWVDEVAWRQLRQEAQRWWAGGLRSDQLQIWYGDIGGLLDPGNRAQVEQLGRNLHAWFQRAAAIADSEGYGSCAVTELRAVLASKTHEYISIDLCTGQVETSARECWPDER